MLDHERDNGGRIRKGINLRCVRDQAKAIGGKIRNQGFRISHTLLAVFSISVCSINILNDYKLTIVF